MSDKPHDTAQADERISAAGIRQRMSEKDAEAARVAMETAHKRDETLKREFDEFMQRPFTDADLHRIRKQITDAADQGLYELEVLRFPSQYLADHGRRINNAASDWPDSLQGYAKRVYDAFRDIGKEEGFRFVARVLNFPGGKVGEIGLSLSWKE